MTELTQEKLKEFLTLNIEIGVFSWNRPKRRTDLIGKSAGRVTNFGYVSIKLLGKAYLAHRLVWLWKHGVFPKQLDHINGIKTDNRICNLRECTTQQNGQNCVLQKNNTSGFRWVHLHKRGWQAKIKINGKHKHLGYYKTQEIASEIFKAKAREVHGEFYCERG